MLPLQILPSILVLVASFRLVVGWLTSDEQCRCPSSLPEFCDPIANSTCDLNFNSTCCVSNVTAATCISVGGDGSDPAVWKVYQCTIACVSSSSSNSEAGCLAVRRSLVLANCDAGLIHELGLEGNGDMAHTSQAS
jgi:hypothetical protein